MLISDHLVQLGELHDDALRRKLFPVNIRLLRTSTRYRKTITGIVRYMEKQLYTRFSDYGKLHGISGANLGIPFNIVVVKMEKGHITMINPTVVSRSDETREVESNCGSLNLDETIKVERYKSVRVRYYPFPRRLRRYTYKHQQPVIDDFAFGTVQHEIDHNNGVLITDREKKDEM